MPGTSREIRLFKLANFASRNPYVAYTIAISAVVLATLIRFGIDAHIVQPAPFVTYYPAIILVAFFCGLGPAILAVGLSGVISWYAFLPPPYSFTLDKTQTTTLLLFFIVAGINVAIVGLLNRAMARIVTYERFARSTADELAIELRTANILREIGIACASKEHDLTQCLKIILEGALRITGAPKGNIQLFNPSSGAIEIAVHRGFEEPFLKFFAAVRDEPSTCVRFTSVVNSEQLVAPNPTILAVDGSAFDVECNMTQLASISHPSIHILRAWDFAFPARRSGRINYMTSSGARAPPLIRFVPGGERAFSYRGPRGFTRTFEITPARRFCPFGPQKGTLDPEA